MSWTISVRELLKTPAQRREERVERYSSERCSLHDLPLASCDICRKEDSAAK